MKNHIYNTLWSLNRIVSVDIFSVLHDFILFKGVGWKYGKILLLSTKFKHVKTNKYYAKTTMKANLVQKYEVISFTYLFKHFTFVESIEDTSSVFSENYRNYIYLKSVLKSYVNLFKCLVNNFTNQKTFFIPKFVFHRFILFFRIGIIQWCHLRLKDVLQTFFIPVCQETSFVPIPCLLYHFWRGKPPQSLA